LCQNGLPYCWCVADQTICLPTAVTTIRQRYFDAVELLFPDSDRSLSDLIKHTEELITSFNDQVIKKSEDKISIEALRQNAIKVGSFSFGVGNPTLA
jgi:hypothetical protein